MSDLPFKISKEQYREHFICQLVVLYGHMGSNIGRFQCSVFLLHRLLGLQAW